mmetsp:Transcript_15678/g.43955  ORF Transcript_15678/g.43955 Transcript_15678/m.43955 type:complete len:235 (+) Transcript_15678:1154-1858(+)
MGDPWLEHLVPSKRQPQLVTPPHLRSYTNGVSADPSIHTWVDRCSRSTAVWKAACDGSVVFLQGSTYSSSTRTCRSGLQMALSSSATSRMRASLASILPEKYVSPAPRWKKAGSSYSRSATTALPMARMDDARGRLGAQKLRDGRVSAICHRLPSTRHVDPNMLDRQNPSSPLSSSWLPSLCSVPSSLVPPSVEDVTIGRSSLSRWCGRANMSNSPCCLVEACGVASSVKSPPS